MKSQEIPGPKSPQRPPFWPTSNQILVRPPKAWGGASGKKKKTIKKITRKEPDEKGPMPTTKKKSKSKRRGWCLSIQSSGIREKRALWNQQKKRAHTPQEKKLEQRGKRLKQGARSARMSFRKPGERTIQGKKVNR